MRRTTLRRTAAVACAVSLTLLSAACGSGTPEDQGKKETVRPAAAGASGGKNETKALPAAELEKLILNEGELKNYAVVKREEKDVPTAAQSRVDKAVCAPLAGLTVMLPVGSPAATAGRVVIGPAKEAAPATKDIEQGLKDALANIESLMNGTMTTMTMQSYDGDGAAAALESVRKSGAACGDGFTVGTGAGGTKVTKIESAASDAGDESAAFTLTSEMEGKPAPLLLKVVRKDGVLVSFASMHLGGSAKAPTDVIEAQLKKLG
jgi:hypothetical protein